MTRTGTPGKGWRGAQIAWYSTSPICPACLVAAADQPPGVAMFNRGGEPCSLIPQQCRPQEKCACWCWAPLGRKSTTLVSMLAHVMAFTGPLFIIEAGNGFRSVGDWFAST